MPICECGFDFARALLKKRRVESYAVISHKNYSTVIRKEHAISAEKKSEKRMALIAKASLSVGSLMRCPDCGAWLLAKSQQGGGGYTVLRGSQFAANSRSRRRIVERPRSTDMQALPFHVTSEAMNHIRNCSRPRPEMQATMCFAFGFEEHDQAGHLKAKFEGEHFFVGYHYMSTVKQWPRLVLGGRRIAIHPRDLARLRRKVLTLRKLDLDPHSAPYVFPEILVIA